MDPQTYGQIIFDKAGQTLQWKKQCLQQEVLGKLDSDMQKNELGPLSYTIHTKINSKWMRDLNVRQEAIKILEEQAGKNLSDLARSNFLLNMSPEVRETKAKMNYWDVIKIKSFCTLKETSAKLKGNRWNGRRYLQMAYQIKG